MRLCMRSATPNRILRLAAAQSTTFFRPSPFFLVAATARQLGRWARKSDANEHELASKLESGIDALLDLALDHCELTIERIRELHLMRFSIINPIYDVIDKCVGQQWYAHEDFWDGGVSDAYTIDAEPTDTLFHLAIYGELFAPDFETILKGDKATRKISVDTRLEFVKYCIPDVATTLGYEWYHQLPDGREDPRRACKKTGPYAVVQENGYVGPVKQSNIALTWVLRSSRFRRHWKAMRERAGEPDFQEDFDDGWWYVEDHPGDFRQRMWEDVMVCPISYSSPSRPQAPRQ